MTNDPNPQADAGAKLAEPCIKWCEYDDGNFCHDSLGELLDMCPDIEPGQTVWVGEVTDPGTNWIIAEQVIDRIADAAYEIGGEHAEDFPRISHEAKAELDAFLRRWQAEHCQPTFWTMRNVKPYTVPATDDEIAAAESHARALIGATEVRNG